LALKTGCVVHKKRFESNLKSYNQYEEIQFIEKILK